MDAAQSVMSRINTYIVNPLLLVVFALGFFMFVYGLVEFLWKLNEGGENSEGKKHMVWGIVGMLIMVSVYGILDVVTGTFGIDYRNPDVSSINNISAPSNLFGN